MHKTEKMISFVSHIVLILALYILSINYKVNSNDKWLVPSKLYSLISTGGN